MRKTLILGVGNSILCDDTIGLVVTRKLEERYGGRDDTDFGYNEEAGFSLLEESLGYGRLVIVDSILTGEEPGTIHRLDLTDLGRTIHSNSPHGMNLATVLAFGRAQGLDTPDDVRIYAIEVVDTVTFCEDLTPELAACVDSVVDEIAGEVFRDGGDRGNDGGDGGGGGGKGARAGELYLYPQYYDIAFTWYLDPEIEFFGRVFSEHVPFPVKRILEPCCGTGRFLLALPRHGYSVTGYDVSPEMLEYARARVADHGDPVRARAIGGDMVTARFEREYDAALNSINSIGYLQTDEDVVAHLRNTGASLKEGGVYIVHIACAWEGEPELDHNTWTMERGDVTVKTSWRIERDDPEAKLSQQICTMEVDDNGERSVHVFREAMRLWFHDDVRALVEESGALRYEALYSEGFERLPLDTHVTGEMGNLYHVLKAV